MGTMSDDKEIAWPAVVVIENLDLGRNEETRMFMGLDNKEIRSAVEAMVNVEIRRVIALYNHTGHTGRAFVVFPDTEVGYMDAMTLHHAFQHMNKGRDDLRHATPEERLDKDGKKVLFGYLATPADMNWLDRKKVTVKRWSVESFNEKVLKPQLEKQREAEVHKLERAELQRSVDEKAKRFESEEQYVMMLKQELSNADEALQAEYNRQEEARRKYEEEKSQRKLQFESERAARMEAYAEREKELRDHIEKNRRESEEELMSLDSQRRHLEGDISEQKLKERELNAKVQAYQRELKRGVSTEEVLLKMKNAHAEKVAELKDAHREQLKELMKKHVEKKRQLVTEYEEKQAQLDGEIVAAEMKCKEIECAICMEEFDDARPRALYAACGHARVCLPCSSDNWRMKNKKCPLCNQEQQDKPKALPPKVFF